MSNKYIFGVIRDYRSDINLVYVNEENYFLTEYTLLDVSLFDVMSDILGDNFKEEQENVFSPCDPDLTKGGIIEMLKSKGLEHNEEFQEYLDTNVTEY